MPLLALCKYHQEIIINNFSQFGNFYTRGNLPVLFWIDVWMLLFVFSTTWIYTSCYFYQRMFPEIALLSFTTWKVQWYFLPNQNLENNNFSTKLARNWMLRSEIIGTLFLFSDDKISTIILPYAWILLSGVFCSNCFPFSAVLLVPKI